MWLCASRLPSGSSIWLLSDKVRGLPRSVEFVAPLDLIAVGTYQGWKLLLLDARTFETLARVPTCDLVRGLVFDDVTQALYVGDGCGVLRIRFTEGWRARRADP